MKNLPLLIITLVTSLALIVGVAAVFSSNASPTQVTDLALLVGENRPTKGKADAKVTVVEFSDFQCPACRAIEPLVAEVAQKYPDQVKIVYRHFPLLSLHKYALLAAHAAEAAGTQGKFWEMHTKLFSTQGNWSELEDEKAVKELFATYATELGIDKALFLEKIDSDEIKQSVAKDLAAGDSLRVDATPTFYVNGRKLAAPQQLLPTVESELTK